jgi:hypothetical protein
VVKAYETFASIYWIVEPRVKSMGNFMVMVRFKFRGMAMVIVMVIVMVRIMFMV